MHILAFEKELSCHLYTFEGQFHIIYSFGKRPQAIFHMGTFSKRLIMLPILKYAYVERHFSATHSHFARNFMPYIHIYTHTIERCFPCYLYSHTYIHTIERYFPCYLDAKYPSWGSQILVKTLSSMS